LAVVAQNNGVNISRPMVRIVGNEKGPYLEFLDADLSLSENAGRQIVRIIDPTKYNMDINSIILSD
ncbi:MAG: hypothetical protein NTV06_03170, partial [candidate division Zixibacteria bacterium]|nr:hypothetical protein [candidate division Zixibacteria bacterium]